MSTQTTTKMLICLWKGCEHVVFEEAMAFQEHVIKHVQEQMQPPILGHQKYAGTDEEQQPMAKKAKLGEREIVFIAVEVWLDVFGFIKRIQLARTVSLTSRLIHQICWPRMHGDKVAARMVQEIHIVCRDESDGQPTALILKDGTALPLVSWPLPPYISGFSRITINFLDRQVLELLAHISTCFATNKIIMSFVCLKELDEKQRVFVGQLANIFCDQIEVVLKEELDIQILMEMLATPRPDGQQRAMNVRFHEEEGVKCARFNGHRQLARKMRNAIKKEFHASTQPLPQPFYLRLPSHNSDFKIENQYEVLHSYGANGANGKNRCSWEISRHPKGKKDVQDWLEDGRKRLWKPKRSTTFVTVQF